METVKHTSRKPNLVSELRTMTKKSQTADLIAHALAGRQRIRGFTDIRRLKMDLSTKQFELDDKDLETFFTKAEEAGLGHIIYSRQMGGNMRFIWNYNMKEVGEAIVNESNTELTELSEEQQRECDASRKHKGPKAKVKTVKVETSEQVTGSFNPQSLSLVVEGKEFIAMNKEQYEKLQQVQKLLSSFKDSA